MARIRAAKRTPEERAASARKAAAGRTPEARAAGATARWARMTPEERSKDLSERTRKARALQAPEERTAIGKMAWENRQQREELRTRDEQAVIEAAKAGADSEGNGGASHTPEARRLCAAVDRLTGEDGAGR